LAEGASERGKVGERSPGLKRGEDVQRWPENARSWARPWRGTWVGGWGRADRWAPRNRESGHAGARKGADRTGPRGNRRERGSARAGGDKRDPPVRHRGRAGTRLGLLGRLG
jgi:hypothetical protein